MNLNEQELEYCKGDAKNTYDIYDRARKADRQYRILNICVFWPIRILIFPVMFTVKVLRWTYNR